MDTSTLKSILTEIRILQRLDHGSIVRYLGSGILPHAHAKKGGNQQVPELRRPRLLRDDAAPGGVSSSANEPTSRPIYMPGGSVGAGPGAAVQPTRHSLLRLLRRPQLVHRRRLGARVPALAAAHGASQGLQGGNLLPLQRPHKVTTGGRPLMLSPRRQSQPRPLRHCCSSQSLVLFILLFFLPCASHAKLEYEVYSPLGSSSAQ